MNFDIRHGNALDRLREMPDGSVNCCITSPPYFGLRDYGTAEWEGGDADCDHARIAHSPDPKNPNAQSANGRGAKSQALNRVSCAQCGARRIDDQIGLEPTPEAYISKLVAVFREVRRVLRDDGTCFVNVGDSYANDGKWGGSSGGKHVTALHGSTGIGRQKCTTGLKPKDLIGIPWALAKALRDPYYTGRIKSETDRAWMAAIVDGEGSICGYRHERVDDGSIRTGVNITITNSSSELLNRATEIWSSRLFMHNRHGVGHLGKLQTWRWAINGTENRILFLREIYPYIVAKKRQAAVAYTLLLLVRDAKRLGHSPQAEATREKRDFLVALLSDLNKQKTVEIPSWIEEPPSVFEPGYYLRQDIIWHKPNPMPESVKDRCTKAHEYIFLLSKSQKYWYDAEAIAEAATFPGDRGYLRGTFDDASDSIAWRAKSQIDRRKAGADSYNGGGETRNKRSVWSIPSLPTPEAHFATFPIDLPELCLKVGCPEGGTVLDPFSGAGTTGLACLKNGRNYIGIELNAAYIEIAHQRARKYYPLLIEATA